MIITDKQLHPYCLALLMWGKLHPHSRITIIFQDGIPVQIIAPSADGMGFETVLMDKIAREFGLK